MQFKMWLNESKKLIDDEKWLKAILALLEPLPLEKEVIETRPFRKIVVKYKDHTLELSMNRQPFLDGR